MFFLSIILTFALLIAFFAATAPLKAKFSTVNPAIVAFCLRLVKPTELFFTSICFFNKLKFFLETLFITLIRATILLFFLLIKCFFSCNFTFTLLTFSVILFPIFLTLLVILFFKFFKAFKGILAILTTLFITLTLILDFLKSL